MGTPVTSKEKWEYLCKRIDQIADLVQEIKTIKRENQEKDKKINYLEKRVDDLEQYTRREDVVISGLDTGKPTWNKIVIQSTTDEKNDTAPQHEQETLEDKVVSFMNKHGVPLLKRDISVCHTLGRRENGRVQPIVIRFVSRKTKTLMMSHAKRLQK